MNTWDSKKLVRDHLMTMMWYFEANQAEINALNPRIHVEFFEIINPRSQLNDLDKDIHINGNNNP